MRSSVRSVNALSPESTVTSLLSSSGHLTSNLQPPTFSQTFSFKDKEYDSASTALDAYISDFERSRRGAALAAASMVLPPSNPRRAALGTLRNRDVLRERLSERELEFLSLPVSSLRHRSNRDRVSMTTDELLDLPNDGSMPITHTTAFIHGHLPKSRLSHSHSALKQTSCQNHTPRASHPIRMLHCSRCAGGAHFNCNLQRAGPASVPPDWPSDRDQATMHLPHWLSSNKAAVDCSEVHSLPDLPYPPWIQHCHADQSESGYDRESQSDRTCNDPGQSLGGEIEDFPAPAPSWVLDLEEDQQQVDSEQSLKSLRLQFAEHISHLASERTDSLNSLHRDQRILSLIQKADRVLDSLQNSATGSPVPSDNLDQTEGLLVRDLDPGLSRTDQPLSAEQPQPGPLEAFKQILFRLEAVEMQLNLRHEAQQGALQEAQRPQETELRGALQETLQSTEVTDDQNPEVDDGGPSLQRALRHLSRLKLLVESPQTSETPALTAPTAEDERDEGRYSSSSTEQQGAQQDTEQPHKDDT